jgi:hypothetical protein
MTQDRKVTPGQLEEVETDFCFLIKHFVLLKKKLV